MIARNTIPFFIALAVGAVQATLMMYLLALLPHEFWLVPCPGLDPFENMVVDCGREVIPPPYLNIFRLMLLVAPIGIWLVACVPSVTRPRKRILVYSAIISAVLNSAIFSTYVAI
jgi:hypothetical protein